MRFINGARTSAAKDERGGHVGLHRAHKPIARTDVAALEAQLEDAKQMAALLRAELADMRAQKDMWRTKAEESRLAVLRAIASRARPWWRRTGKP
jgi:hypothetical protein